MKNDNEPLKNIVVDSNGWNFLYDSRISLTSPELSEYNFQITKEVSREMERLKGNAEKEDLYDFFLCETSNLESPLIYFGFHDPNFPEDEQRFGGFGVGGFASVHQRDFFDKTAGQVKTSKRGVYYRNEADRLIGSRGINNTYILTGDLKAGPLKEARNIIPVKQGHTMTLSQFKDHLDTYTAQDFE